MQSRGKPKQPVEKSEKIKVCLMITKGIWGGAQEYVYTLATSLPKHLYEVVVLAGKGQILQDKLQEKNIHAYTISSMRRDVSIIDEVHNLFELIMFLRKEKPDILHLNSSKIGLLGGLAGRIVGVRKIIFTAHGWYSNEDRPWYIQKFFLFLHWLTVLLSHTTIVVSEKTKQDIAFLPFLQGKLQVIYNGISDINFKTRDIARSELAQKAGKERTTDIVIGTISELHKNKGLDYLIKAAYTLPPHVSVYVIGSGEEKENLERLMDTYNVPHKVFLVGRIPNAREYLKAFDIFTLTSRTEALPYTILEAGLAGASGVAVVASQVGGIPEIIEDKKNGILIHLGDVPALEHTLHTLIQNPKRRIELGKNLQEKVIKKFNVSEMIKKTEKVYRG